MPCSTLLTIKGTAPPFLYIILSYQVIQGTQRVSSTYPQQGMNLCFEA